MFILFEDNAPCALFLGNANLLLGMGGERVGSGQKRRFGAEAVFVSDVSNLCDGAVWEGEPAEGTVYESASQLIVVSMVPIAADAVIGGVAHLALALQARVPNKTYL